jgi:hypothetical protein
MDVLFKVGPWVPRHRQAQLQREELVEEVVLCCHASVGTRIASAPLQVTVSGTDKYSLC